MTFSTHFYCEKSSRGYVTAGIQGTTIEVVLEMDEKLKERLGHQLQWTTETARQWDAAMDRLAEQAEKRVRAAWKEHRKGKRR